MTAIDNAMLDRVADAIEQARCPGRQGPYGLFDYTSYGDPVPHHVRDFRDPESKLYGSCVGAFADRQIAVELFETLTRHHIALAAIEAMSGHD